MADQADTSSMAYEPVQMSVADMKKMLAQNPTAHALLGKARRPVPEDFKGCKCATSRCRNRNCPCHRASYPCTWKCKCVECGSPSGDKASDPNPGPVMRCKCKVSGCTNMSCCCLKDSHRCSSKCECKNCRNRNGVSGSEPEQPDDTSSMAREPPQMDSRGASKRPRTEPSQGIEPEQADTSSMAYVPMQMSVADMKKMLAQNPTAHVLLGKARRPVPEDFKGCKCATSRCRNRHCPCHRASYPCTWKCKCVECGSPSGDKASDPNRGPVMRCKCKVSGCTKTSCSCLKDSLRCNPKCECKNCRNRNGVSGSEPEKPDDTSSMAREPPQMDSRGASKRPRTE